MVKSIWKKVSKIIIILLFLVIIELIDNEIYGNKNNNKLEIYFFDVGQADSILIKENDKTVLIDAGNDEDGDNLVDYIKNDIGLDHINIIVGTHPHEDHVGGLDSIINSFKVDKIYLPNIINTTKNFEDLLDSVNNNNLKISIPKIGDTFNLDDMMFEVVYVDKDQYNLNDSSIVLRLDYFKTSYLFMGDASSKVENKILDKNIDVDLLKVGHHGSNYSTSSKFLNKVSPKYAIIEVGKNNDYNHPSVSTLKRLENENVLVYRTDKDGTIKAISDGKYIEFIKINTNIDG